MIARRNLDSVRQLEGSRIASSVALVALVSILSTSLCIAQGTSNQEWREQKKELKRKVTGDDAVIRAEACKQLARFNTKGATALILEGLEAADAAVQRLLADRATLYKRWEEVKIDWRIVTDDQKQKVAKYRSAQSAFADHYRSFMRDMQARRDMVEALGTITDPVSIGMLCDKVRAYKGKKGFVVRSIITEAFATVQSPEALQVLINLTSPDKGGGLAYDPQIAIRAIHALGRRTEPEAQKAIVDVLGRVEDVEIKSGPNKGQTEPQILGAAEEWQVRAAAVQEIGRNKILIGMPVLQMMMKQEEGRLKRDAAIGLGRIDRRKQRVLMTEIQEISYPCLDLDLLSRNIVFLVSAGETMSWLWDTNETPSVDEADNEARFKIARDGVKDYLRSVLAEYEELKESDELDVKKDFKPFRFNICIYQGYSEFYAKGMCEVTSIKEIDKIEEAITWLDWSGPEEERTAVGEANLVEALDKTFNLAGFGAEYDEVDFEHQPDTIVCLFDISPNAGAFCYRGSEDGEGGEEKAWDEIKEFLSVLNWMRQVQVCAMPIGTSSRIFRGYVKGMVDRTEGAYIDYTPSAATSREERRRRR